MSEEPEMNLESLLTPSEAAALLRMRVRTLHQHRRCGVGPPFVKIGRMIRYRASDLTVFVEKARQQSPDQGAPS